MLACCKWQAQKGEERVTLGSSLEKASARLLLNSAATLPNIECRSAGNRMGDNTCTTWSTVVTCMLSMPQSAICNLNSRTLHPQGSLAHQIQSWQAKHAPNRPHRVLHCGQSHCTVSEFPKAIATGSQHLYWCKQGFGEGACSSLGNKGT